MSPPPKPHSAQLQWAYVVPCCISREKAAVDMTPASTYGAVAKGHGEDLDEDPTRAVVELASRSLPGGRMTAWQAAWCTPKTVSIYLAGRQGNVDRAAEILTETLLWRERYRDVLDGTKTPVWQGDMRVLRLSDERRPIVYAWAGSQPDKGDAISQNEHTALVLESAVKAMADDIKHLDAVWDFHGFQLRRHLDPRPVIGLAEMIKQPYRDRLRVGIVVSAPRTFGMLWKLFSAVMSESTRKKIRFYSYEEACGALDDVIGPQAATHVRHVMAANRSGKPIQVRMPSELVDR
eukprot:TRINITY_DN18081_c0_g1_i1.p1 TRINITY_DN18081_c0_g1~~TRINITY_DN18081_c0_g1_i1.p1  ORF type:complete len:316 (+),score=28.55 TRINITY_DN18081_c0_g1_i1:73-948(+)